MANLAALIPSPKAPLIIHEVPKYTPGPNELLVRNSLIAFNPVEFKLAKLAIAPLEYPAIIGSTFTGTIEAVGENVKDWKVGEKVVVSKKFGVKGNQYGAYQRFVVVGDRMVCRVPEGGDGGVLASLMVSGMSLWVNRRKS